MVGPVEFPAIPDRIFFTIGEVSEWCQEDPHVLRYWESEFKQLKPIRKGNRRFFTPADMNVVRNICLLLRDEKYTIEGAKGKLGQPSRDRLLLMQQAKLGEIRRVLHDLKHLRGFCLQSGSALIR